MGTRATYKFNDQKVTFYIHWDGYLEGAAVYFRNALLFSNQRGGMAEAFLRANDDAEITRGHDAHGDTEFQYTVAGDDLSVNAVSHEWETGKTFSRLAYSGTVLGFVNNYTSGKVVKFGYRHYDEAMLLSEVIRLARHAAEYTARFGPGGNSSSNTDDAFKALAAYISAYGYEKKPVLSPCMDIINNMDLLNVKAFGWDEKIGDSALAEWRLKFRPDWSVIMAGVGGAT